MALGTPYKVCGGNAGTGSATLVVTVTQTTTAGDCIAVWITSNSNNFGVGTPVTDSQSNTYVQAGAQVTNGALNGEWWVALNANKLTASTDTITLTLTNTTTSKTLSALGCSGVATSSAVDQTPTPTTGNSTSPSITSGTLAQAAEFCIAGLVNSSSGGAVTWGGTFASPATSDSEHPAAAEYGQAAGITVASTSAVTASGTITSTNWGIVLVTLKAAPVTVTGVTAALALAAPAGAPGISITVPGVTAPLALAAPPGSVTTPAAFPAAPLDLRAELYLGGAWVNVTSDVLQRDSPTPVTFERGRKDEGTTTELSTASFQLNNRSGNYTPTNPAGAYYGQISRNTPVRFSVPAMVNYGRLEADAISYFSTPDAASLDITGDTEVQLDMRLSDWTPCVLASKWAASSQQSWNLQLLADGTVTFTWSHTGADSLSVNSGTPLPLGRIAVKATLAVATGTVTFYTAPQLGGSWTQLGAAASGTSGASTTVFSSSADVEVGNWLSGAGTVPGMNGRIFGFQLLNGIGGTVEANPDFTGQGDGTTFFADALGNPWTAIGTAAVSGRDYRFHGELSSLPATWDVTGTDVWAPVAAAGLLRRLGQGNAPLDSAIKRSILDLTGTLVPHFYWPCEDLQGSTSIGAALGGTLMSVVNGGGTATAFAADSNFDCSASIPTVNNGVWHAALPVYTSNGSLIVRFLLDATAGPPTSTVLLRVITSGTAQEFQVVYTSGGSPAGQLNLKALTSSGSTVFSSGATPVGLLANPSWVSMELTPSGGNINWQLAVLNVDASSSITASGSHAGTVGVATGIYVNHAAAALNSGIGHITIQSAYQLIDDQAQPLAAWTGELAANRFERLCDENGLQARIYGPPATSAPMGVQTPQALTTLLTECQTADMGIIYEPRQVLGLGYRPLAALANQAAAVTLDYSAAELGGDGTLLAPSYDDQYTHNDITATRQTGSSATSGASFQAQLNDGSAMSISQPPAGVGDYANTVSPNVEADLQLPDVAWWLVHLGTVNENRWPQVPVNMARTAVSGVQSAVLRCDIGDYAEIVNPPTGWLRPDPVRQLVAGTTEVAGGFNWRITFHCIPESPYETGLYDDATYGRADTDGSVLYADITTTATAAYVSQSASSGGSSGGGSSGFLMGYTCNLSPGNAYPGCAGGELDLGDAAYVDNLLSTGLTTAIHPAQQLQKIFLNPDNGAGHNLPSTPKSDWTAFVNQGGKLLISAKPASAGGQNSFTGGEDTVFINFVQGLINGLGVANFKLILWQEPTNGNSGFTAGQYQAYAQHYYPLCKTPNVTQNVTVVYCPAIYSAGAGGDANALSFYPGDNYVDEITADFYTANWCGFGTSIDSAMNGLTLPQPSIILDGLSGTLPTSGTLLVTSSAGVQQVAYTGKSGSTFTGCTGGTGTLSTGAVACVANGSVLTNVAALADGNTNGAVPFGLSEWGLGQASIAAMLPFFETYVQGFYSARLAAGKAPSWAIYFGSTTTDGIQNSSDPKIAPIQALVAALSGGGSGGGTTSAAAPLWTTAAGDFPFDIAVGGERMTVTNITGTTVPQTFTVTRSVNGVVAAHSAGADVRLWFPPIYAVS